MPRLNKFRPWLQTLENRETPATFTVTNLLNNGAGSLRSAILAANGNLGADTVDFQAGLSGMISLTGGDINVTESVTIQGPGAKVITVSGAGVGRIFTTKNAVGAMQFSVIGLTLTGGQAAGGGAVLGDDERLILQDCQISGNTSTAEGGAILLTGDGDVQVFNTTINGNSATLDGGGICVNGAKAEMYIYNSTLSGNTSGGDGGGVYIKVAANNALFVWNTTITSNNANRGGGVALDPASAALCSIDSSIISNNAAPIGPDLFAPQFQIFYSAIGSKAGVAAFSADATTNSLLGQDFKLGSLVNNGGNVTTHKPAIDSPVRDKAQNISGSTYDSRGTGYPREINALVDCGAVECDPLFIVKNDKDSGPDSLRQQIIDANVFAGANTITFDAVAFAATDDTITLTSVINVTAPLSIVGPGARLATISGNNAVRILDLSAVPTSNDVKITGLTLANGSASDGGAILVVGQNLTITDCTLKNNTATTNGGAIHASTAFTNIVIRNSTLSGNVAAAASSGGAIAVFASGSLLIENSTIAGNTAGDGAAISFNGGITTFAIRNSTIVGNTATSTINGTGGVYLASGSVTSFNLESSIVAGNIGKNRPDFFVNTPTVVATKSAIGSATGITNFSPDASTTALLGQDFKLGTLANNGGQTDTILPTTVTSPVVDAGSNSLMLANDQRGVGYGRVRGAGIDIGAVEFRSNFIVTNKNNAGAGSLRQAVTDADSFAGEDTITFDATAFASPTTITLNVGIAIDDAVTIQGRGANLVTISAPVNGRSLGTSNAPAGAKMVISGLRFINGNSPDFGGAIEIGDETVFIVACEFSGNTAATTGGAIEVNGGNLTLVDSTLANNTATAGNGGGLHFTGAGSLIVRNSTFSGNKAAANNGGGVSLDNHTGASSFMNCTFTLNSSFSGGGIGRFAGSSTINVESCIVSGNSAASGPDIATSGTLDAKTSLLGTVSVATFTKDGTTNTLLGQAAKLDPLASNGGPTRTHALQINSPAISKGSNPFGLDFDQRGVGYARVLGGGIDIGSVERNAPAIVNTYGFNVGESTNQRSLVTKALVIFDSIVSFAGTPSAAFKLERQSPPGSVTLNASIDNSTGITKATLTFVGGTMDGTSLADGRYTLSVLANQITGQGLDGQNNGGAGDDFVAIGSPVNGLFRLFGDADGNGSVTAADFNAFRLAYGSTGPSIFDFDGDNQVTAADFNSFRTRYGVTI